MTDIDWTPNIAHLLAIRETAPGFWDHLSLIADGLVRSDYTMVNDHNSGDEIRPVEHVTICQTYTLDGKLWPVARYAENHPTAWIFSGPYAYSHAQSKNPLYLDDNGVIHLTTCATGMVIRRAEILELLRGVVVSQTNDFLCVEDRQFTLPTKLFVDAFHREKLT